MIAHRRIFALLILCGLSACPNSKPVLYEFLPPINDGKKFLVSQAFNGSKTHQGLLNAYAVDLVMPIGEPVCAVLGGRIHSLRDADESNASVDKRRANFVRIIHASGVISDYQHLKAGSVAVKTGQAIKQGECFAQVGNTGVSTGPHLHFALLKWSGGQLASVPFKFIDPQGRRYTPQYLGWVRN